MANLSSKMRTIILDGVKIEYCLSRKKVKNINLRVKLTGEILVSANSTVPIYRIEDFLKANSAQILKSIGKFKAIEEKQKPSFTLENGAEFYLLGEVLHFQIVKSTRNLAYIDGEKLVFELSDVDDQEQKEKLLKSFIQNQCQIVFTEIMERTYPLFSKYKFPYPSLKMRSMKSRWGSCMPLKNQINLNTRLIHAPKSSIEYVVLHEFAHFVHPNHSRDFYELVGSFMPDYRQRSKALDAYILL